MGSERNFRSHYYEKMGFRGVEEKKSLDILLREKPIDLARIHNFCLRSVTNVKNEKILATFVKIIFSDSRCPASTVCRCGSCCWV